MTQERSGRVFDYRDALPPDRFAKRPLPPPPSLEERQTEALESIASSLKVIAGFADHAHGRAMLGSWR